MIKLITNKLSRIKKVRKKLEQELNVQITNRGREVYVEGAPKDEYVAQKVLEAIDFGFQIEDALEIKKRDAEFETLNIKEYTKRNDLSKVRARLIGSKGKVKNTLCSLTECAIEINENQVGIIGDPEFIEPAQEAIIEIIRGSKISNVYSRLEKNRPQPILDLGLKE